ncbi:MAG: Kef family K(+) transporter [Sphingomonas sp.]|nr:Kef family K(+) transporter [Sphingomonas sp.]
MPHHTPLIATIVAGLVVAFLMGAIAHRLRTSPVAGYLFAGVIVGPFTPGIVSDAALANELAELGVILLMFGVGLHFSLRDLLSVRKIAIPGAITQIVFATALGTILGLALGWTIGGAMVFGLALSVASTVVLIRSLQSRKLVETERGRIAVGWLIVEDLVTVLALVLLPALVSLSQSPDGPANLVMNVAVTVVKIIGFVVVMLVVGKRVIPALLHWVVHTGSRELFRLAVLAIALGFAFGAAYVFDVSFALGAFFAGMILGETQLSRRAAEETLPLRDAFAVLFFVSVGMLFDPAVVLEHPGPLLATLAIIVLGKSAAAYMIIRLFGYPGSSAMTVSASLAQIGEFSFILAGLGTGLGILPEEGRDLILASSILSILANPIVFAVVESRQKAEPSADQMGAQPTPERPAPPAEGPVIVVGYGKVGRLVASGLAARNRELVVVEDQRDMAEAARSAGSRVIEGNATQADILEASGIASASRLVIAISEGFEAGVIVEKALHLNPGIFIVARAHSDDEAEFLSRVGVKHIIRGEREIAAQMLRLMQVPGAVAA